MQPYKNRSGQSNVLAYKIGVDFIVVQFRTGKQTFYLYNYSSAGKNAVEHMKTLAENGLGLNSYISTKTTQPAHAKKGNSLEEVL